MFYLFLRVSGTTNWPSTKRNNERSRILCKSSICQKSSCNIIYGFSCIQWETSSSWCASWWELVFRSSFLWEIKGCLNEMISHAISFACSCLWLYKMFSFHGSSLLLPCRAAEVAANLSCPLVFTLLLASLGLNNMMGMRGLSLYFAKPAIRLNNPSMYV